MTSPRRATHRFSVRSGLVPAFIAWVFAFLAIGGLLHANALDVTTAGGRLLYAVVSVLLLANGVFGFFLLWRFERGDGKRRGVAMLRAVVAFGATLGLLLSVEAIARALPVYDSIGLNPGTQFMWPEYSLPKNSLGYKDREPGEKQGPRILVLGDSFTEGAGVRRPDRFSNVLEQLYRNDMDPDLEVFNAGHCGMDTLDEARILAATGDQIAPDVVVVAYVVNDADGQGMRPTGVKPAPMVKFFLRRLRSYAFYRLHSRSWRRAPPADEDMFLEQHRIDSPGWQLVTESMEQIAAWAEARSIPAVLVALPVFDDYGERHRPILDQAVAAARARGFQARNGIDDYEGRLAELAVSDHDSHPGKEAHRITAMALRRFVGRPWTQR